MSSVFRKGDVVYHPRFGEVTIDFVNPQDDYSYDGDYLVKTTPNIRDWCEEEMLSFTPWPAPCHVRPFTEVGYWLAKIRSGEYLVRWRHSEREYTITEQSPIIHSGTSDYWIKFLGKEIE